MQDDPVVEQATAAPGEHRTTPRTMYVAEAARALLIECGGDVKTAIEAVKEAAR